MKKRDDERTKRVMEKLAARRVRRGQAAEPHVVTAPDGVLPDEHAQALHAAGRKSAVLCVPEIPQGEDAIAAWAASTTKYQQWLLEHGRRIADGADQSHDDLVRRAYKASLGDGPMPTS